MNKVAKRILIITMFVVSFFMAYFYMGMVFIPKDRTDLGGEKYYLSLGYKAEPKDTLDMVFFGNSNVYSGFDPLYFYQKTGTTSYACGTGKQTGKTVERTIKQMIKRQKNMKVVILETNLFLDKNTLFEGSFLNEIAPVIAPFRYHARWKEIEWKDFYQMPIPQKDPLKGYLPSWVICPLTLYGFDLSSYMTDVNAQPAKIQSSLVKNIKNIKKLCDKNDLELLIWTLPCPLAWDNSWHNAVQNLTDDLGITYVDLNIPSLTPEGFNYDVSFKDDGMHLNVYGTRVCTDYLAEYLEKFNLPNHKGEEKYADWDASEPVSI